jgi:hypothetical protein
MGEKTSECTLCGCTNARLIYQHGRMQQCIWEQKPLAVRLFVARVYLRLRSICGTLCRYIVGVSQLWVSVCTHPVIMESVTPSSAACIALDAEAMPKKRRVMGSRFITKKVIQKLKEDEEEGRTMMTKKEKLMALRKVRMQYAARMKEAAERMKRIGEEVMALEEAMMAEAVKATGGDEAWVTCLSIEYEPRGSIEKQLDNDMGPIEYAGFEDVVNLSEYIIEHCDKMFETGTEEDPPKLPYECKEDEEESG